MHASKTISKIHAATPKKDILETVGSELTVILTVFTASTVSCADRNQAAQDGIALVGADQIATLRAGLEER